MINKTTFISILISILFSDASLSAQNKTNSALKEGEVYKMAISKTGLYKLTYQQIKQGTSLNVDQLNPANIQIYGNRGGNLPLPNAVERIDDLSENSIYIEGANDGSFDSGDYILFYAEGPDRINMSNGELQFEKNIYDLKNYYFLKNGSTPGKRIGEIANETVSDYADYTEKLIRHEVDKLNLLGSYGSTQGSGKLWFGETFTNERTQDFSSSFLINTPSNTTPAAVELGFAARNSESSSVEIVVDGQVSSKNIGTVRFGASSLESNYADNVRLKTEIDISSNPSIVVNYRGNDKSNTEAWLDYIQLISREKISINTEPEIIYNSEDLQKAKAGYQVDYSGSNLNVWRITNLDDIGTINYNQQSATVTFGYNTNNEINSFLVFDNNGSFLTPEIIGLVANQNIHGIERADLLIVTHPDFIEAAEKLADHRRVNDNLTVEIVNIFHIYNEFAGGKSDPVAVRDMARMLHKRDNNFRYMILLGDASYDYRNIVPNLPNDNLVPTYETDQSLNPVDAYPSDDFFGLLSDSDGNDNLNGQLDLGIGRIPARTAEEANNVINKIIHYDTNPNRFGEWRTRLMFAADDVDASWDTVHMKDSDKIAIATESRVPCMLQQKVYFDSYQQEATPGGARYPDANKAINDNIFKGQLVFNYLGHGGPKGLSQERVVQIPDIRSWSNMDKLTVFITATCSFTGFDEPNIVSAGEHLILNPSGGAVAIFTTVRSVYASQNYNLANEVFSKLFGRTDGQASRLGDIIVGSKNTGSISGSENTRKFLLIGDPCMRLALPRHDIKLTHFNDEELTAGRLDTLGALGRGQFRGQIVSHSDNNLVNDFNGEIFATVYDKESTRFTLVNDGKGSPLPFEVKKNILYKGTASVTNGIFDLSMILPKDIDFNYGLGSIHLYATDGSTTDAAGCFGDLIIGGSSASNIEDKEGPAIEIFMDNRSFTFGGETSCEPLLIVDLKDENGINLSSTSIGHDITATLEDQNGDKIVLNDFYKPTINKIGEGTVTYQMGQLEPGNHKLYLKAWDILNNSSEEVIEFVVTKNEDGNMSNVYNYPNPFSTHTEFTFEHDLANNQVDIGINIYTVSGKLIKSIQDSRFASGRRIDDIAWDGRDDYGNKLAKGIYLYKINIAATELNQRRESDFLKLVVLN